MMETGKLLTPEIIPSSPKFYFISEDRLKSIGSGEITISIFSLVIGIFAGGSITLFSTIFTVSGTYIALEIAFYFCIAITSISVVRLIFAYMKQRNIFREVRYSSEKEKHQLDNSNHQLHFIEAKYGARSVFVHVTDVLNSMIVGGKISIKAGNNLVVDDPVPGVRKMLFFKYRLNDVIYENTFVEDSMLSIP